MEVIDYIDYYKQPKLTLVNFFFSLFIILTPYYIQKVIVFIYATMMLSSFD